MDLSSQQSHGVAGSPMKTLEAFSFSTREVSLVSRPMRLNYILHYLQGQLERKYSVELRNAGLADVAIRSDNKIMASGGWDGRYKLPYSLLCFDNQ